MRDIVRELDDRIANDLKTLWGGRLPSWEEFKEASKTHRVRTNKGIASKGIFLRGVPKSYQIIFGIITAAGVFLIPIICVVLYFVGYVNAWVAVGSFFVGWYLYKVTLDGACDGIRYGAEKSEPLYQYLVSRGAFLFGPN
jgi:hypothetical protein